MTPIKKWIAIAKACGHWRDISYASGHGYVRGYKLKDDKFGPEGWQMIPGYPSDLNAMHEAFESLTPDQRVAYSCALAKVCGTEKEKIFADAAQQAEAFLKTIGKWEE